MEKAKVYFSNKLDSQEVVNIFKKLGIDLKGKVAIKVHSGEVGNQNFLHPIFFKPIVEYLGGTIVECNTAYGGERNTTEKHKKTFEKHGWYEHFDVDLMDREGPDISVPVQNGKHLKEDFLGRIILPNLLLF